ncbi:MAG: HutD family protein [Labilithrix sp.]|nr:HutD family protein [Labilithrix sp.]MCW5811028.1 HutD family protein [Labilithrix sp.]
MRVILPSEHRRMPWKNGGGTTTEVLVEPGVEDTARFRWRVSIADVASDGPFSRFDGYERHIVLLDGAGMTLDAGAHGRIELARHVPRTFSGDWEVTGSLKNGPVRDFNLIVDRARATAELDVRTVTQATTVRAPVCIAHVLAGTLVDAPEGSTLVDAGELRFVPAESAIVVVARITPS